jgi:hypothetical protein
MMQITTAKGHTIVLGDCGVFFERRNSNRTPKPFSFEHTERVIQWLAAIIVLPPGKQARPLQIGGHRLLVGSTSVLIRARADDDYAELEFTELDPDITVARCQLRQSPQSVL